MLIRSTIFFSLLTMILLTCPSNAAAFGDVRYPDRPLNLRQSRSARSGWVGLLQPGQKVRIGWIEDGWAAVFEPWMTDKNSVRIAGYANVKYLRKQQGTVEWEPWGEWKKATTTLNVRAGSNRGENKVGSLAKGEVVRVDFPEDDWYAVFEPEATIRSQMNAMGWVKGDYLEAATAPSQVNRTESVSASVPEVRSTPTPAPATVRPEQKPVQTTHAAGSMDKSSWGKLLVAPMELNLRAQRASGSRYATTIPKGETIKVDFLKNGWYAVFAPDMNIHKESRALGYVLQRLVEPDSAAPQPRVVSGKPGGKQTLVIPRNPNAPVRKAAPKVDQQAHGFRYGVMEQAEATQFNTPVQIVKIYVAVDSLPKADVLHDFVKTLWKKYRKSGRELLLEVYLPEMNLDDLAFVTAKYTYDEELEFWARKAVLFGTKYLR